MQIVVQKYGGSSLSTLEKIDLLAAKLAERERGHDKLVLVVSAMGETTNELTRMAYELTSAPPARELDMLLATGEQQSIALMAMALHKYGVDAISYTGSQVGLKTDTLHTQAKVIGVNSEKILKQVEKGKVVIVAGFQGVTAEDDVTTLGRGGSDITAMALAVALKAERLEKCTDADGVYTADPRLYPEAKRIDRLSYEEMLEMSFAGAKVLHPRAVFFAWKYRIPILVKHAHIEGKGTWIEELEESVEQPIISNVTQDATIAKLTVYGVPDRPGMACKIFETLASHDVTPDMIVQSTTMRDVNDISFTIKRGELAKAKAALESLAQDYPGMEVQAEEKVAKISLIGLGIRSDAHVATGMFRALADEGINIQMIATSDVKISCVIEEAQLKAGVRALCRKFFL
ncbi:MAG: aspartate kinase [Candidatus Wallbacteria bacterium]|nr:aspartate kinase [Candidatus Wallbacteria bacterium]